jgi:hypothetical protein
MKYTLAKAMHLLMFGLMMALNGWGAYSLLSENKPLATTGAVALMGLAALCAKWMVDGFNAVDEKRVFEER